MALRGALESALYALIASQTKENVLVWVNRRNNRHRARELYKPGNGIQLLMSDPNLHAMAREAYELTIEFGAHPNVRSVAEHVRFDADGPRMSLVYLHAAPSTAAARAIVACIETALVILFICPHAFPGHAAAMTVHSEASKLRKKLDRYLEHGYSRGEDLDDQ
jgi:hypothetical protein